MTNFDKRGESFERRFAHDQDLRFRTVARRNKMLGLWAAERLGKAGDDANDYAKAVVLADFEEAGDDDVVRKVRGDLEAAGVACSETEIRDRMTELLAQAVADIDAGR